MTDHCLTVNCGSVTFLRKCGYALACVAGVKGEGKGKNQCAKRVSMRAGDACKDAIV